ncbi:hypothetical protein [Pseudomonas sp.]|uniref:hypothetical protein n=1 Tax=Pseudomonas sp. TaxID=306 RepID=UPI003CC5842D
MSFGFKSLNDSSYVQIDSDLPRLCMLEKGSYQAVNSTVNVSFARVITTIEPPMVFIRPAITAGATELYRTTIILGSAGAWTGFQITSTNVNYQPAGSWFSAAFASRGTDAFGMRIFDASGAVIYDTGAPSVVVTNVLSTWTYIGQVGTPTGASYYCWTAGRALLAGEYYMLNVFSMALQNASAAASVCAVSIDYANNQTRLWGNGFTAWTNNGHRPVVFAKLVA